MWRVSGEVVDKWICGELVERWVDKWICAELVERWWISRDVES